MKDAVKQVIAIDTAFTRLKMVTQASDEQLSKMKSTYISLAREMKVSLSTVTDAAEAWLRTGMNAKDANDALQASIVLSTVAFMDGATATQYLVAAQKAYGLEAKDLMGVVDKLAILDSNAATTAADLGEALSMSASSAGLAGIELDKYLAILATTSETTQQSASNIGNAWKTILARLQQVKLGSAMDEEGQDISNVDKLLKEYNIDLLKETDNLENMEGLLDTLGERWKNYTAMQKSEIATIVAGVRQRDKLIAALNNYDRVIELTTKQTEEEGAAQKKMQDYMGSTQAKINNLKTAWTELADATLKSEWFEWLLEMGKAMLDTATKAGGLIPIIVELAGAYMLLKGAASGNYIAMALGGALAAGGILTQVFSFIKSEREESLNNLQKSIDEANNRMIKEESNAKSLIQEYLKLNSILEKTTTQKEKLSSVSKELADALGIERGAIEDYILDYDNAVKAYYNKIKVDLNRQIKYTEGLRDTTMSLLAESQSGGADALEIILSILSIGIGRAEVDPDSLFAFGHVKEGETKSMADILSELIRGENPVEYESNISKYNDDIERLTKLVEELGKTGEELFESSIGLNNWEQSEVGAKKLEERLSKISGILTALKNSATTEEEKEDMEKIIEYYSVIQSFYEQELKTFRETDFVLTEYYDKQLKALKEQKELEDELAKQKEEQQKIADAELKVQEGLLDVEKARAALAEAREKKIKVFRMGKGMVYEEDTASIASAQQDLDEALGKYADALKNFDSVFAQVYGTATEQLITAVERLEKVYDLAMLDSQDVRTFFQTPENLEKYQQLSQEEQLSFLMSFMGEENKKKAIAMWGLDENTIEELGNKVRNQVFGTATGGAVLATDYLPSTEPKDSNEIEVFYYNTAAELRDFEERIKRGEVKINKKKFTVKPTEEAIRNAKEAVEYGDFEKFKKYYTSFGAANMSDDSLKKSFNEIRENYGLEPIYHSGGIVGEKAFSSDSEMYAKLLKGEIVLPQGKFNSIIDRVQHSSSSESTILNIGNISLPNVDDADSFVRELQRISFAR